MSLTENEVALAPAKLLVQAVHHVGLVVKDEQKAKVFYRDMLGFQEHPKVDSWLMLNDHLTLHLIEIPEATVVDSWYHQVNHVALQVVELRPVLKLLLDHGHQPFQMDFEGTEKPLTDPEDSLDFGLGTIFVTDFDSNLLEFVKIGHGMF